MKIRSITLRTALLSWLVTLGTLVLFVTVTIPLQQQILEENLNSKAIGVAVSLRDVAAGAAVNEDLSSVVDHCEEILKGDKALDYIVITKNDGFSLILDRTRWRRETNADRVWRPEKRTPVAGIGVVPIFNRRVYYYSQPFDYSAIQWGWIHVGLSLTSYDRSVALMYSRTGLLAVACLFLSLVASGIYARRLVRPILNLRTVLRNVAGGNLAARAVIESSDELGSLAGSVNNMTEALLKRDWILQSVRFAAQQFLSSSKWDEVIDEVLARIGAAATASRVYVFELPQVGYAHRVEPRTHEWDAAGISCQRDDPNLQRYCSGQPEWTAQFQKLELVVVSWEKGTPAEREILLRRQTRSMILIPIPVEHATWGLLGLDDCRDDRQWTKAERDSLQAAADMLGAAITRQRTQDSLLKAKEAAEAANKAKSQFLANMSHEIRTPINGVLGMLQLLQNTRLDEKQRRYVGNSLASADTLLTVIGDVLDFSKIEADKLELVETAFSVADILDIAARLLAEKAESKGLELACRIKGNVAPTLIGDADRLRQVLLNLLSNAVKFTERGTIVVSCAVVENTDDDVLLKFQVNDTGSGITSEKLALIFDAFVQVDNSMSRMHGGTGLGLTISRQLVLLMGGQIGVESTPGQGSSFWFTVRFKQPPPPHRNRHSNDLVDLRGLRVLIVDDCPVVREILCDYVRTWKGIPEEAPEAAVALNKLRTAAAEGSPFSVAVVDWQMPGTDGLALARVIKHDPVLASTGIVLLSSFAHTNFSAEGDERGGEAAGFATWLYKPARKSDLYDAIIRAANRWFGKAVEQPAVAPPSEPDPIAQVSGTIVLAEDNEINQEVACEMLATMGYRCIRARNGKEALAAATQGAVNLVLMDCQMPEMDGYEAARHIREWEAKELATGRPIRRLPIVALTAHAMKGDRERCLEAGMDDYLTKPLEPANLANALALWMPQGSPGIANSAPVNAPAPEPNTFPEGIHLPSLLNRCMGKENLAHRLVQRFIAQGNDDLRDLESASLAGNSLRISQISHRIKGSAANVSAEAVRHCAGELERLSREDQLDEVRRLVPQLRAHLDRVKDPLVKAAENNY